MAFRTILTVVGTEPDDTDVKLAARLCEASGAHLSVLVVAMAAPPPIGEYAAIVSEAWMQERQAEQDRLNERSREIGMLVSQKSVSGDVADEHPELAWADEAVGRRARYADLMLVGPSLLASSDLKEKVVEGTLFSSGRPLLLVPQGFVPTLSPRRVLVAWDASLEASRAVSEALDILAGAEEVRVALVDPAPGAGHGEEPGSDIAAYLARHGATVFVDRLPSEGLSVADVLRRHAADCSAEMIVMGAYGHSRLRERIFGGVTRSMVENPALPTFMAR